MHMVLQNFPDFTEISLGKGSHTLDHDSCLVDFRHDDHGRLSFFQQPDGELEAAHLRGVDVTLFRTDSQRAIEVLLPSLMNTGWEVRSYDPDLVTEQLQKQLEEEGGTRKKRLY